MLVLLRRCLLVLAVQFFAATCAAMPAAAQERGPLVLAASSLQESLNAAADAWQRHGHARPVLSFAGSSLLARQIEAGAPADMFISADEEWMDAVARNGLLRPGTRSSFLGNSLVLIAPAGSRTRIAMAPGFPLGAALGPIGRLAMANPDSVPAGKYGKAALQRMGVWPAVRGRVAAAENVRAAMLLVSRGEAPLGVVYATDAMADRRIRVIGRFPAGSHPPIRYPMAVLKRASHPDADAFRRFLLSREGRSIFARFGFTAAR